MNLNMYWKCASVTDRDFESGLIKIHSICVTGLVPFDHGGFYPLDYGGVGCLYTVCGVASWWAPARLIKGRVVHGSGKMDPCTNEPGVFPT